MQNVRISSGLVRAMVGTEGTTVNVTGGAIVKESPTTSFQAILNLTSGSGTATVTIEASNDGVHWNSTPLGTITLSGSDGEADGFTSSAPWKYVRAEVSGLTGTGATVKVLQGN